MFFRDKTDWIHHTCFLLTILKNNFVNFWINIKLFVSLSIDKVMFLKDLVIFLILLIDAWWFPPHFAANNICKHPLMKRSTTGATTRFILLTLNILFDHKLNMMLRYWCKIVLLILTARGGRDSVFTLYRKLYNCTCTIQIVCLLLCKHAHW